MSHSFSNNFIVLDNKYSTNRDPLQALQGASLTNRVTSNPPNIATSIHYRQKIDYYEPVTSTSLGSYKTFSPYKVEPPPDTLETMRRLVEIAIQNKWTNKKLDSHWQQFKSAFNHYDSKVQLDNFFKSINIKPSKKKSKSEPKRKHNFKEDHHAVEKTDRNKSLSFHRQMSYNYAPFPRQPVKILVKSNSDHFKVPTVKIEQKDQHKHALGREKKMLKLCEYIEEGLAKGHKVLTTRGMPF